MLLNLMITQINIAYDILFFRQSWRVLSASYESSTKTKNLFALLTLSLLFFAEKIRCICTRYTWVAAFTCAEKSPINNRRMAHFLCRQQWVFSRLQKSSKINTREKRSWMDSRFSFRRKVIGWGWGLQRISKATATMRVRFFDETRTNWMDPFSKKINDRTTQFLCTFPLRRWFSVWAHLKYCLDVPSRHQWTEWSVII